jgi:hypothetical protein
MPFTSARSGARGFGDTGRLRRRQHLGAAEMVDQREQVGGRQHLDPPSPRRLAPLARRADQPQIQRRGTDRRRQHAGDRIQSAIERQFAKGGVAVQVLTWHHLHCRQHGQRDGQVEMAAFLQQVRRRQIDQHPSRRQGEADGGERGAHPLACLAYRLVRQSDQQQRRRPPGDLHLHFHRHRLDAGEGEGAHPGDRGGGERRGQGAMA